MVDGNLISARTPADLGPWMRALLAALEKTGNRYGGGPALGSARAPALTFRPARVRAPAPARVRAPAQVPMSLTQ